MALDAGGAADVSQYSPDIVLLQEVSSRASIEKLAQELFHDDAGSLVGDDTAIIARGKVVPAPLESSARLYFSRAQVRMSTGREIEVITLHLATPPVRLDLWSPAAWSELSTHRRKQIAQMEVIAKHIASIPEIAPVIIGGDFNAPPGDPVFGFLGPRLRDAFREGGFGWGNTHPSDLPVLRIDQIWISEHFRAREVRAHGSSRSDHRLVVGDLWLRDEN